MKKPKYRLQIVLERKEEAKKQAAIYLSECREELRKQQEEEERLRQELKRNLDRREDEYNRITVEGLTTGFDAHSAQNRLNYIKRLDQISVELEQQIEQQHKRVQQAEEEVSDALQQLIQASRELQVMEKHKDRWQQQVKREMDRQEQLEMNEIGNVMYLSKHQQ